MKIPKILLLALTIAPLCQAADSQQLAEKILDLTGTEAAMQQGFDLGLKPALDQMQAHGMPADLIKEIKDESEHFFAENFKWAEVKPQFAQLYAEAFTEAELSDLLKFYETPTGQKAAALMPSLMQKGAGFAMNRVQAKMPDFQHRVGELIKAYQDKAQAAAAAATPAITPPAQPAAPHQP